MGSGEFAAAFGIFLLGVKLQDDLVDSNRWYNRVLWVIYRARVRRAERILDSLSPGLVAYLASCIERYLALQNRRPVPSLEELMSIVGDGFYEVFSASAELTKQTNDSEKQIEALQRIAVIGRHVGQAIVAWDCAEDFEFDQLERQFTPLKSASDVRLALEICWQQLTDASTLCPDGSTCQGILKDALRRVKSRQMGSVQTSLATRLEHWGLLRKRSSVYLRCEFPCCCVMADAATCCISIQDSGCCRSKSESPRLDELENNDAAESSESPPERQ